MSIQKVMVNPSVAVCPWQATRSRISGRGLFLLAVASVILYPVSARSQQSGTSSETPNVVQPNVKLVIGGDTIQRNSKGTLSLVGSSLRFATKKGTMEVKASSILDVSTNEDSKQDINGGGRVLSLLPHGVDFLTLEFTAANGGYHAAIFVFSSQGQAAPFKKQLVARGAKASVPLQESALNK